VIIKKSTFQSLRYDVPRWRREGMNILNIKGKRFIRKGNGFVKHKNNHAF